MKKTAWAPVNIALIKYWGKKDKKLNLPYNSSISVNLSNLYTITTVEFSQKYKENEVLINGERDDKETQRVINHIERIKELKKTKMKAKIVSQNNFPKGVGIASSASGFAALTLGATSALCLSLNQRKLSILARLGSGSACRSIPSGFVEWQAGDNNHSFAKTIFPQDYWSIKIATLIFETQPKEVSSSQGHLLAETSPFFKSRLENINRKINNLKKAIEKRNFVKFGEIIEQEALELYAIMLTSNPPLIYWEGETLAFVKKIFWLRKNGFFVFFTIDAGPNIHLFYLKKDEDKLKKILDEDKNIKEYFLNSVGRGAYLTNHHLF